jgi:hypothetical protein
MIISEYFIFRETVLVFVGIKHLSEATALTLSIRCWTGSVSDSRMQKFFKSNILRADDGFSLSQ